MNYAIITHLTCWRALFFSLSRAIYAWLFFFHRKKATVKLITLHYANWTYTLVVDSYFFSLYCGVIQMRFSSRCGKIKERLNVNLISFSLLEGVFCGVYTCDFKQSKSYVIYGFFSRTLPLPRRFPTFVIIMSVYVYLGLFRKLIFISMTQMKYLLILHFQNKSIQIYYIDSGVKL